MKKLSKDALFEDALDKDFDFFAFSRELADLSMVVHARLGLEGESSELWPLEACSSADSLVKVLSNPKFPARDPWEIMDKATYALGQVARNIKSVFYQRIVGVRRSFRMFSYIKTNKVDREEPDQEFANREEAYKYFFSREKLEPFIREYIECHDLLLAEIDLMPESAKNGIWAKKKCSSDNLWELPKDSTRAFTPTKGMTCEEATEKSRAYAEQEYERKFAGCKDKVGQLAAHFGLLVESLRNNQLGEITASKNGVGAVPLGKEMVKDLAFLLQKRFRLYYDKYYDMDIYFDTEGDFGSIFALEDTGLSHDYECMLHKLYQFLASAAARARNIGSKSADMFIRALELVQGRDGHFQTVYGHNDERAALEEFMETLQKAQVVLSRDLEIARFAAKPPVPVEVIDKSVRKLADATGKSVKRAIKPGKGSANERYAHQDELMRIWEKYSGDKSPLKGSLNHKIRHKDVFNYSPANLEIAALRSDPPITLEEFERSLGAFSDRKSRQSPAKRNKPR